MPAVFKATKTKDLAEYQRRPRSHSILRRRLLHCPSGILFLLPLVWPCLLRYVTMASRVGRISSSASHASAKPLRIRPAPYCSSPTILMISQQALPTVNFVRLRRGLPRPLRQHLGWRSSMELEGIGCQMSYALL